LGRHACKLAFSYGIESDPIIAANFLSKLTRATLHSPVPAPPSTCKPTFFLIPLKAVTTAGMPKKSAPHRDGWTLELFMGMDGRSSTVGLLRKFIELFANGLLPRPLWKFLSSAIIIPFHKLAQMERLLLTDRRLRPITIGAMLTRFYVRSVLRIKRKGITDVMLKSNQFS
jgi:hypothetical protein